MKYLIYGSYGFTGSLIVAEAKKRRHDVILAGRSIDKLQAQALAFSYAYKAFEIADHAALCASLNEVDAVLHCGGPFALTARQMIEACIETKTHYIDITGEIEVFELAATYDKKAKEAGIVLLPGAGFDVVPTDCMAAYLKSKLNSATHLEMGFHSKSAISRGTALTMVRNLDKGGAVRENGRLRLVKNAFKTRKITLAGKNLSFVSIPWGDLSTAYFSTGIPNIVLYMSAAPKSIQKMKRLDKIRFALGWSFVQSILKSLVNKKVKGPTKKMQEEARTWVWGEVKDESGNQFTAVLETPEGYTLTALASVEIVARVCAGAVPVGFQTPSKAFGYQFVNSLPGVDHFKNISLE